MISQYKLKQNWNHYIHTYIHYIHIYIYTYMCVYPKSLQMVTAAIKLKDAYSLEGKL